MAHFKDKTIGQPTLFDFISYDIYTIDGEFMGKSKSLTPKEAVIQYLEHIKNSGQEPEPNIYVPVLEGDPPPRFHF